MATEKVAWFETEPESRHRSGDLQRPHYGRESFSLDRQYEVTRLDPPPPTSITVKEYRDWSKDCLEVTVSDAKILAELNQIGTISAYLVVRQSTSDESGRIKNWLVKQQSGFMQGLYSHMLGDFQYQNQTRINRIPIHCFGG